MAQKKIRLALCDDMEAFCRCLKRSFEKEPDIEVVGIAGSAAKCLELVRAEKPDVLLLDMQMEMYDSGAEIIPSLKEVSPDTKIIMLTIHHEDDLIFRAFTYGAIDYLTKSATDEEILALVRKVYHNTAASSLSPDITQAIINEGQKLKQQNASLLYILNIVTKLTTSEYKILKDLCMGLSYRDIASKRFVEEITIRSQISRITKKFDVQNIKDIIKIMNELKFFDLIDM